MKLTANQVYVTEVKQGRKKVNGLSYKQCGFRTEDVERWVEGEISDTTEIHFYGGSSIVIISKFEEFDKLMTEAINDDYNGLLYSRLN